MTKESRALLVISKTLIKNRPLLGWSLSSSLFSIFQIETVSWEFYMNHDGEYAAEYEHFKSTLNRVEFPLRARKPWRRQCRTAVEASRPK
jgi:hypothetical protein